MRRKDAWVLVCLMSSVCFGDSVYQIGNSLTWDSCPECLDMMPIEWFEFDWVGGHHIRTASTLSDIWEFPAVNHPSSFAYPNPWPTALGSAWDNLVLQVYRGSGQTLADDLAAINDFASLQPDSKLFVYAPWPETWRWNEWDSPILEEPSQLSLPRQAYYEFLLAEVTKTRAATLIPVGQVLHRLKMSADQNQLPFTDFAETFYRDTLHLSYNHGRFTAMTAVLTAVTGKNPTGVYYSVNLGSETSYLLESIVWDVIANNPLTGVVTEIGDYDGSGEIDISDYDWWQTNFGAEDSYAADGNQNGEIDLGDYAVWRDAYSTTSTATAVPEKGGLTVVLLIVAVVVLIAATPRRK